VKKQSKVRYKVKEMISMRSMRSILLLAVMTILVVNLLAGFVECAQNEFLKYSTIHEAAEKGDLEDVVRHLNRGTAVNAKDWYGFTPLFYAVRGKQIKVADFLIKNGAEINVEVQGFTPLDWAAMLGHIEMVQLLIREGSDLKNAEYASGVMGRAVEGGHIVIALEIAKSADIRAKDKSGYTLLHKVARWPLSGKDYTQVVELLIKRGADVNAKGVEFGDTPLHMAAYSGQAEIAKLLIENGADVNAKYGYEGESGETPLHWALSTGGYTNYPRNIEIVKVLVENGADVNIKDREGKTPLHRAVLQSIIWPRVEIVRLLVEKGADVNAKDNNGNTPLGLAIWINETEAAELLRQHGAKE
jgi:ankyrin repeat protein